MSTNKGWGTRATGVGAVILLSLAGGCESEDRRAFNDAIDQEEANARETVQLYEGFENELMAELRDEYGAGADSGCPEIQSLPAVRRVGFAVTVAQQREWVERAETERAARTEAWLGSIPAEHCNCIQETLHNVRGRRESIDLGRFDEAREEIAEISDEALTQRIAFTGVPEPGFSPEAARNRITNWNERRREDWRGSPESWNDSETAHGWEDYRYEARGDMLPESDRPILTNLQWNYRSASCANF
ncbi:MAG: hypothetical protein OXH52_07670 [Gammaproteobacteria bacterium]|nr:hypothetical protein [Gammaproteobacteria bacterium]